MEIAAYLLEIQFWCSPGVGNLYPIFKPHCGALQLFQNKLTNAQAGVGGGGLACLEVTEPLINNVILPGKLSILCNI